MAQERLAECVFLFHPHAARKHALNQPLHVFALRVLARFTQLALDPRGDAVFLRQQFVQVIVEAWSERFRK